mmetsp:Transcript_18678/g.24387  ORF Transcript_18678/g.24387 Transcript_18678/m.24387 type:complete len:268 (+) Transcript_18678:205-1008(+)
MASGQLLRRGTNRLFYKDITRHHKGRNNLPVVLLHHGTGSTLSWRRQEGWLSEAHRIISYDRIGHGQSSPLSEWSAKYHQEGVEELIFVLDSLNIQQCALLGHSDGATISLLAAAMHPDRISCVVAEAPHMYFEDTFTSEGFRDFRKTMLKDTRFQNALSREHGEFAEQVQNRWLNWWESSIGSSWDDRSFLPLVRCPVMCLHGEFEKFFSLDHVKQISTSVQQGELTVLKAGHDIHNEAGEEYKQVVSLFLEKHNCQQTFGIHSNI